MSQESSIAPKERINIVFKPASGDAQEEQELPLRLLMIGEYTLTESDEALEDRSIVSINKNNFNDVLASKNVQLDMVVKNTLDTDAEELSVNLNIKHLADFSPDYIATQIPELNKLLEVRRSLTTLKGPLGNIPAFRKQIQKVLRDKQSRESLFSELKIELGASGSES
ncbi:MAG: type VI secretion system contractile sheath small subunit [Thiohalomonadales bacterium]